MKKLLILAALAGFGAVACGDDSGDTTPVNHNDAGVKTDASAPRPQQIENGKTGLACTAKSDCGTGPGATCLTTQGQGMMSVTFPGGYCSATCETTLECGTGAACPVAEIITKLPSLATGLITPSTLASFGIPTNCLEKCTDTCSRTGYKCTSFASLAGDMIPAQFSSFLGTDTYCLPPITIAGDAGVPDAGTTTTVRGMDGGV